MKHLWKAALGVGVTLLAIPNAQAQLAVAKVVATCGTVSPTPHAGANYPLTIDITGTLCSVGGGGGGGGGTSSNFGAAFPGAGTAAGFEYLSVAPTLTTGQMVAGQTDVNGNLKVNVVSGGGSNASVGTTAAAVPGSATYAGMNVGGNLVGLVGTANGLAVQQATAANLNATVSPVLAATWGLLAQSATTSGQLGQLMMGAVTTAAPTYSNAQSSPLSLDTTGALRVNVTAGGGTGGTSSSFGSTFPSTGTAAGLEYLTTPPTLTNGQMVAGQTDVNGNLKVNGGVSQSTNSVPISISTATTTQLVALSSGKVIQITSWDVVAAGTGNITLEYGTGTACNTGTTALTGAYNLAAQAGISKGDGLGPVLFVPAGNALCAVTSAAVGMAGSVSYLQF